MPQPPQEGTPPSPPATAVDPRVLGGTVTDAQGRAVEGAVVDSPRVGERGAVVTDAEGRFRLPTSGSESLELRVRAVGYVERWVSEFAPGATDVTIVLEAGSPIHGRVLDSDGRPVAGARVRTHEAEFAGVPTKSADGAPVDTSHFDAVGTATTDEAGRYVLVDLSAGNHLLRATARGFAPSDSVRVAAPAADVEIRLAPGLSVVGAVRDRDGKPIEGATVSSPRFSPHVPHLDAKTDARGEFRADGLPAGRLSDVGVHAEGFAWELRKNVRIGGPPLSIVLEPERTARLRVRDPDGHPLHPVFAEVRSADGAKRWCDVRNAPDGIEIRGIGEGPYVVVISEPGYARAVVEGVRGDGPPLDVTLRDAALSISCRGEEDASTVFAVPAGSAPPLPSRDPFLRWASPDEVEVSSGEPVSFEIRNLLPGKYDLLVMPPWHLVIDGPTAPAGLVIPGVEAGAKDVRIELPTGVVVSGSVRLASGAPARFSQVQAYDARGLCRAFSRETAEDGTFRVGGLAEGRYRLVAWLDLDGGPAGMAVLDDVPAPSTDVVIRAK